jgi:hypothetical protein
MGSEVLAIGVGQEKVVFNIHKNLLIAAGKKFQDVANTRLPPGRIAVLHKTQPDIFKLFQDYLYQKRVPPVMANTTPLAQSKRLKDLCQFYVFADELELNNTIRNKIMDAIQDGFVIMDKLPDPGLVDSIYSHTTVSSKLRKFCAASLVYTLRSQNYAEDGSLPNLLNDKDEVMDDFLAAVRELNVTDERDPRIRDCRGEPSCAECTGRPVELEGKKGVWPCYFHIHKVYNSTCTNGEAEGAVGNAQMEESDPGCYLWNY